MPGPDHACKSETSHPGWQAAVEILTFVPMLLWQLVNLGLTYVAPSRLLRLRPVPHAAARLYRGRPQERAEELVAAGFQELGALERRSSLMRDTERVFWHPEGWCYAHVRAIGFDVTVVLVSEGVDGALIRTDTRPMIGYDGVLHDNVCDGSIARRLTSHRAAVARRGGTRSTGTLEQAVRLQQTLEMLLLGREAPPAEAMDLARVPSGLEVSQEHHQVTIVAPRQRGWDRAIAVVSVGLLGAAGRPLIETVNPVFFGVVWVAVYAAVDAWVSARFSRVTFALSPEGLKVTRTMGSPWIPASERLAVDVRGSCLVIDDGDRRVQVRVGETAMQRQWLAQVIRTLVARPKTHETELDATLSRALATLAVRAKSPEGN